METELDKLIKRVKKLSAELDKRVKRHEKLEPYLEGDCPLPEAITKARLTKVYRYLMPVAEAPWGSLIVGSKLDRLEVSGLRDPVSEEAAERIWGEAWQPNEMDSESKLGHGAALLDGRCYATVWPGKDGTPDIALDDMTQMIVEFAPGSRRHRVAALRRWKEDDRVYATLYLPDGVYKFQGPEGSSSNTDTWEKREVEGEEWPLNNLFKPSIPVVEIAVNRRLKPGSFPYARGEFEHCCGLIDRINLLTFLGLVIAFWQGFPLRGVIGEKIRREVLVDDDNNPIIDEETKKPKTKPVPPFEVQPDSAFQLENPNAKLAEFKAADRGNMSIYGELDQLGVITATPRHYFPLEGGIANINSDTVMAFSGAMHAAVTGHKASLGGGGWKEVARLCGLAFESPVTLSPRAQVQWKDQESRSLAERADAASKLKDVIPPIAVAELALNATQDDIARWAALGATNPLLQVLEQLKGGGQPVGGATG